MVNRSHSSARILHEEYFEWDFENWSLRGMVRKQKQKNTLGSVTFVLTFNTEKK